MPDISPFPAKNTPRRLKKLTDDDILRIDLEDDNCLVVTKQETAKVIRDLLDAEVGNLNDYQLVLDAKKEIDKQLEKLSDTLKTYTVNKLAKVEKDINAYIDFRIDATAQKLAESLLSKKFNEEVDKRVNDIIEKAKLKKQGKGFG